jgi:membrane protease subunit HflK
VLANTSKVLMTVKDGNNLMYIPLDKLMDNRGRTTAAPAEEMQINATPTPSGNGPRGRTSSREGGTR